VHRIGRTGRAGLPGEAISLVAPQDMEAMAAIERLIRKKIERVLIPGFEPSPGTVAVLMGGQPSKPKKREQQPQQPSDPIFSRPYEPTPGSSEPKPEASRPKRRQPQVAALLGGRKDS
jgi:ATP-dependent RNA helicase RhlE